MREELFVADERTLDDVSDAISTAPAVAIDTEFVRERTYYPELCLIQIATPEVIACIDCLGSIELAPLFAALLRPDCHWVLHSSRQDLEVIWNRTNALPAHLCDTQIAAGLIGFHPQLGLQDLIENLLGVRLAKGHTRTDWSKRPLPAAALHYALDDVRHLLPAWVDLHARLVTLGRFDWFEEDCARLTREPPVADLVTVFRRLMPPGLSPPQQRAAFSLVEWRERRAQTSNRPRRWIMADEHLLRIARALPVRAADLRAIADLPRGTVAHSGAEILTAVAQSDTPEVHALVSAAVDDARPDKSRAADIQVTVKRRAEELGIQPEVLATRRDINALAAGADLGDTLSGWRAAELARVLAEAKGSRGASQP